ncbi:MAG: right-handed parallel beta-helix repeat-containing protein [Schlesneria sp.]
MKLLTRTAIYALFAILLISSWSQAGAQTPGFQPTVTGSAVPKRPVHIFYIDPVKGSMNGDGSSARPWSTLQAVWAAGLINGANKTTGAVHAGDLIYLMTGNHGSVGFYGTAAQNTDFISVAAAPGNKPVLNQLTVSNGSNWVFAGITFQNPSAIGRNYSLVEFDYVTNVVLRDSTIYSVPDVSQWTATDWSVSAAYCGVRCSGAGLTIRNNKISNILRGVLVYDGDNVVIDGNLVDCYADDGVDFSSSNTMITRNTITNHYGQLQDGNHGDGIQGWPSGAAPLYNILIDRNFVIASTNTYSFIPPVPTGINDDLIQGISIFDGSTTNLTATNNVICDSAYHGLSFYGLTNSVIANNTLVSQAPQYQSWVGVFANSLATPANVYVRNNIAPKFNLPATGVTDDCNISLNPNSYWSGVSSDFVVADPSTLFVKFVPATASFDFNLTTGSPAIGAGNPQYSPTVDILGRTRNLSRFDIGAYAYVGP